MISTVLVMTQTRTWTYSILATVLVIDGDNVHQGCADSISLLELGSFVFGCIIDGLDIGGCRSDVSEHVALALVDCPVCGHLAKVSLVYTGA